MASADSMYPYGERQSSVDVLSRPSSANDDRVTSSRSLFSPNADNRISLVDFLLIENEDVKERGNITREQLAHFVDLTYVATVFNINHLINACGDSNINVVMLSVAYFFILFTTRYHFDIYSIMFYSIDLVHRCLFLIFNLGVFVMTLNIKFTHISGEDHRRLDLSTFPEPFGASSNATEPVHHAERGYEAGFCVFNIAYLQGFASGYLASRITLILMYSLLIHFARVHKELDSLKTYVVKVIPLFIATIVMIPIYWENVNPLKILLSVAIIEILGDIVPEVLQHYLMKYHLNVFDFTISMRPSVDHLQDRLQEFFLIVLGESMIGLLINQYSVNTAGHTYLATLFSFTLMFSLGTHFLVCVHRSADQVHAMKKKNALIRIIYIWMHPIVCYILLIATNALVQLTEKITHSPSVLTSDSEDRLKLQIAAGIATTVAIMVVMRILHKGVAEHLKRPERVLHILLKFGIALLHLCLYWMVTDSMYFILAESILTTSTNMVEMLIPLHTKSRAVDILKKPDTVDSTHVAGAQHELNANRKSVLQRALTRDLEHNSIYKHHSQGAIELKHTINPVHNLNRSSNSSTTSTSSHKGSAKYKTTTYTNSNTTTTTSNTNATNTSTSPTASAKKPRPVSMSINSGGPGFGSLDKYDAKPATDTSNTTTTTSTTVTLNSDTAVATTPTDTTTTSTSNGRDGGIVLTGAGSPISSSDKRGSIGSVGSAGSGGANTTHSTTDASAPSGTDQSDYTTNTRAVDVTIAKYNTPDLESGDVGMHSIIDSIGFDSHLEGEELSHIDV